MSQVFEILEAIFHFIGVQFIGVIASIFLFIIGSWMLKLVIGKRTEIEIKTEKDVSIIQNLGCFAFVLLFLGFFIVNNYII